MMRRPPCPHADLELAAMVRMAEAWRPQFAESQGFQARIGAREPGRLAPAPGDDRALGGNGAAAAAPLSEAGPRQVSSQEQMAKLTKAERDALPDSDFGLPGREYPIQDLEHGEKALELGAHAVEAGTLSAGEYRRLRAKVHLRYPGIGGAK